MFVVEIPWNGVGGAGMCGVPHFVRDDSMRISGA
jgi:hypothetical protein